MKQLQKLSEAMGVSGAESEVRKLIIEMIKPHVDDYRIDRMGNILALKRGTDPEPRLKVMIDAHMDEVGLMVTGYDSNGMLKVAGAGGLDDRILLGKRVLIGSKKTPGVIGAKPIHLLSGGERDSVVNMDALRVDIGVKNKEAAEGKVELGTRIGFDSRFMDLGAMVRGKAFDDRAGCSILVHLLKEDRYPFDLWGTFTVAEETGKAGARVAAHQVCPDLAIVLEATMADDLPQPEGDDYSKTTIIGEGPAISVMDPSTLYDARLNRLIMEAAEQAGIPMQVKRPGVGGNNSSEINRAFEGVPVTAINVPCRYLHAPFSMLSKKDYQNTLALVRETLKRVDRSVLAR